MSSCSLTRCWPTPGTNRTSSTSTSGRSCSSVGQILFLRREQGRLHELLPLVQDAIKHNPGIASFRCALALLHVEASEPRLAAAQLTRLAPNTFACLSRDATYTTSLAVLAEVAARLRDRPHACTLSRLLAPYAGKLLIATKGIACLGAADRYLAMLAATRGDRRAADTYFESALALERKVGSEILQKRTRACRTTGAPALS